MKIITLAGRRQSGKGSIGQFLLRNHLELFRDVWGAKEYQFSTRLKEIVCDLFAVPRRQAFGDDIAKSEPTGVCWYQMPNVDRLPERGTTPLTVRELLQQFGTNIVRRMSPDAWVNACLADIRRDAPDLAIITDARFPNEVEAVQRAGGKAVLLTRGMNTPATHESEAALNADRYDWGRFDGVIDNQRMGLDEQNAAMAWLLKEWGWSKT